MLKAPIPKNEVERLQAVKKLGILDTAPEERFDRFTKEATIKFQVPISTISIIDKDRVWYKSTYGQAEKESNRADSFCGHAMFSEFVFIVEDTLKDPRFADNPNVINKPHIRFYAGVALHERESRQVVGVFCVKDVKPRQFSAEQIADLLDMAGQVERELNISKL